MRIKTIIWKITLWTIVKSTSQINYLMYAHWKKLKICIVELDMDPLCKYRMDFRNNSTCISVLYYKENAWQMHGFWKNLYHWIPYSVEDISLLYVWKFFCQCYLFRFKILKLPKQSKEERYVLRTASKMSRGAVSEDVKS